jgi:hypothetical protein
MVAQWQRAKADLRLFKDPRSRAYGVSTTVPEANPKKIRFWTVPSCLPLNQGSEGFCVGYGWSGELAVDPVAIPVHNQFARMLFNKAREIDLDEGRDFGNDGATLLAGAKAAKQLGLISEYRWCFGIDDVRDSLVNKGPIVLGINWYDGMYETETNGLVRVNGGLVGGHCILLTGYWPYVMRRNGQRIGKSSPYGRTVYQWTNSYGIEYGLAGRGYISETDLDRLLKEGAEACVATDIAPTPKANKLVRSFRAVRRELCLK